MTTVDQLIRTRRAHLSTITAHLDALPQASRKEQVLALGWRAQRRLFEMAAQGPEITLEHFVPADVPDLQEVVHHGRNTFPTFRFFQKRFCRPAGEAGRLFGYNHGPTQRLLGPGYFVTHPTMGQPGWPVRGAVVVDYFMVPDAPVSPGWPAVIPNSQGGQRLVYDRTRDFMRRVSQHVSVGRAWKEERKLPAYFVLCREDGSV